MPKQNENGLLPKRPPPRPLEQKPTSRVDSNEIKNSTQQAPIAIKPSNIKEEKTKKLNKENIKNSPKGIKSRKGVITTILSVLIFSVLGVSLFFILTSGREKLSTPEFKIIKLLNETAVEVENVEGAKGYRYFIYDENKKLIFNQEYAENYKELSFLSSKAGIYYISVQAIASEEKYNSDVSTQIKYTNAVSIDATNFYVNGLDSIAQGGEIVGYKTNGDISDDTITWSADKNATKYYVYYGIDDNNELLGIEVLNTYDNEEEITFNLKDNIYDQFGAGVYNISIVASNDDVLYYLDSNLLCLNKQKILIEYSFVMNAPSDLNYDTIGKVLNYNFYLEEYDGEFEVVIKYEDDESVYRIVSTDVLVINSNYTINLSEYISDNVKQIWVKAIGNQYLKESSYAKLTIN